MQAWRSSAVGLQPVPPLVVPELEDVEVPPPVQWQLTLFHEPPLLTHWVRACALQPLDELPPDDEVLVAPLVPEVPDDDVVDSQKQVVAFQWRPPSSQEARSLSSHVVPPWQWPLVVHVPPPGQSAAARHSTHRPTPLGGAEHLGVVPLHWSGFLQKPAGSAVHCCVWVLQDSVSGQSLEAVQEPPVAILATQVLVSLSQRWLLRQSSSVVQEVPAVPLLFPRARHSPSTHSSLAAQSSLDVQPSVPPVVPQPVMLVRDISPVIPTAAAHKAT